MPAHKRKAGPIKRKEKLIMASTFRGKWQLYVPHAKAYAAYKGSADVLYLWFDHPGKETIITFFVRSDSALSFLLSNGKYVGPGPITIDIVQTLAQAGNFALPGHDHNNLPASFTSKIRGDDQRFLADNGSIFSAINLEQLGVVFTITQITPSLESIQVKKNGDGLDLTAVDLTGGELNDVSLIGTDFSHSNLTNVKLTKCTLKKAQLNNCIMLRTDFSGSTLTGANLNHVDLTGAVIANPLPHFHATLPPSATDPRPTFFGSKLNHSFLGNDWSGLDLTGATIEKLSSPLSSQANPLKLSYSLLSGLNNNDLSDLKLPYAVFDNSVLDGVNLNGSDLTHASFIQASMHRTNLSNATLKNANMTGAQLGSLGQLFTLPPGYEAHLNAGSTVDAALRDQFEHHGITLSATATLHPLEPGRVWQLNDLGNKIIYTVRLETQNDSSQALMVYKPAVAASLVNAYMPDAILTGANLFGITANDIQFYGSNAKLDGSAILEDAKFNNSNLSTVNFTQAQLRGANLSNCHLFNAKFNKANLSPSASGSVADLSNANLQGADFTGAQLYGANLTNAAVAIPVPTKVIPKQGGVYLFSLPYNGDTATVDQYTTELGAEALSFFSLNPGGEAAALQQYLTALKTNNLTPLKIAFVKHKITLSADAKIQVVEADSVWQIVDGTHSYTLWTDPNEKGDTELYAGQTLTITKAGFKHRNMTLRWQASAKIDIAGQQWLIDNDSENPKNFLTGYVRFIVQKNGNVLDVYGTALRILRLGDQGHQEYHTENCGTTILTQANMDADTICPNGAMLSVNQSRGGKIWDTLWMRAATPPKPPDCVPTDYNYCPPSTVRR
jgi:uncharacterized protein YjbI with pentapeptide repeats